MIFYNIISLIVVSLFLHACSSRDKTIEAQSNEKRYLTSTVQVKNKKPQLRQTQNNPLDNSQLKLSSAKLLPNPHRLVGLSSVLLTQALGAPSFVRRDGSSEIWQYLTHTCILDIFLYREKNVMKIEYVELRERGYINASLQNCYQNILKNSTKPKSG